MTKPNFTYLAVLLDRSGSMQTVREGTVEGLKSFLTEQKKQLGECKLTLVQFDDKYEPMLNDVNLQEVSVDVLNDYSPRGSTALLDGIGRLVDDTGAKLANMKEEDRPSKVVVVIQTDGQENASVTYGRAKIAEMITHQREKYNWEFLFLGANQDAIMTATKLGMLGTHAMSYGHSTKGTNQVMLTASAAVTRSRGGGSSAFTADEYAKNDPNAVTPSVSGVSDKTTPVPTAFQQIVDQLANTNSNVSGDKK